jgi:hypothetical protein
VNPKVRKLNRNKDRRPKPQGRQQENLPCYARALVEAGLADKNISVPEAYELFLRVSNLVKAITPTHVLPRIAAPYAGTINALNRLSKSQMSDLRGKLA